MRGMVKRAHIRKERTVFLCRPPILCTCGRQIVAVKEHIARVERTQCEIRRSIARPLIESYCIGGSSEESCTLSRKIVDLLRNGGHHLRVEERREQVQRGGTLPLQEMNARTQEDCIGIMGRVFPAFPPCRKSLARTPRLDVKCGQKPRRLDRLTSAQALDSLARPRLVSA